MENLPEILKELIEGGFIGQAILATLVWGILAALVIAERPISDRLWDAGFIVLGYFFHVAQSVRAARLASTVKRQNEGPKDL